MPAAAIAGAPGVLLRKRADVHARPHEHHARRGREYFLSDAVIDAFTEINQQKLNAIRLRQR